MKYLLGIDLGTTGCKAALYDTTGKLLVSSYREYRVIVPTKGYVEEDPNDWWTKIIEIIRDVTAKINDAAVNIVGIGISCTNAIIPVNHEGTPLMNAIMQLDSRTVSIIGEMQELVPEETTFSVTGNRLAPGTVSAPSILWIKNNCPDIYEKTAKFLVPTGFIVSKLTGKFTIDTSRASTTSLFNVAKSQWDDGLLQIYKISSDKLPEVFHAHEVVGSVTTEAARLTGLKVGTPVIAGAMDTVSAGIGIGANETTPFLIMGTVGRICLPLKRPAFHDALFNSCNTVELPYLAMAPVNGAGNSLKWFRDAFGQSEISLANEQKKSVYEIFNEMAELSQAGANGLVYLPYLAGERSPHWNPDAKGVFFGISMNHTKNDFIRAVMEGVSFALLNNLEIMKNFYNVEVKTLRIGGGGTRSKVWKQILADILGANLLETNQPECETLGVAMLAGVGTGVFSSVRDASDKIITGKAITSPNSNMHQQYQGYYKIFCNLYPALYEQFLLLNQVSKREGGGER